MNNLAEMVNDVTTDENSEGTDRVMTLPGEGASELETNATTETAGAETLPEEAGETTPAPEVAPENITTMTVWAREFVEAIDENIKILSVKVKNVDPDEDIMLVMPHPDGEILEDGTTKRKFRQFENSNKMPMINLPGEAAAFFSNTAFMIIHSTERDDVKIKFYGVSARQAVFCQVINDMLIPYAIRKIKKNDKNLDMVEPPEGLAELIAGPAPMENLIIRYKQIEKSQEGMETLEDALKYFAEKAAAVVDINHLLHIDNVIVNTVNAG